MKWTAVADGLPPVDPKTGRSRPVLVYGEPIGAYAVAELRVSILGGGFKWDLDRTVDGVIYHDTPDAMAFRQGELVTHWTPLSRPRRRPSVGKPGPEDPLSAEAIIDWALRRQQPGGGES